MIHQKLQQYIQTHLDEQFTLLEEMVLTSSYSNDKAGVDKMGRVVEKYMKELPFSHQCIAMKKTGDHHVFRTSRAEQQKSALLVGHMDTVFPPDSAFNWFRREENRVHGPGVIDMKGGLTVMMTAVKALHHTGSLEQLPITLLFNSDEEIGSPTSKTLIEQKAKEALFALVFECGGLEGQLVTGRKGKTGYRLDVHGKAGHAAFAGTAKPSAILELAHQIIAIEKLNGEKDGLVVNVGKIDGGVGPNSVPESASAQIDTRFLHIADHDYCYKILNNISQENTLQGTRSALHIVSARPPMPQTSANKELFKTIEHLADKHDITVREELRSGVSDANFIAHCNTPVVDGMGPIGDCDHSDREYMIKSSLAEKTWLTAMSLLQLLQ